MPPVYTAVALHAAELQAASVALLVVLALNGLSLLSAKALALELQLRLKPRLKASTVSAYPTVADCFICLPHWWRFLKVGLQVHLGNFTGEQDPASARTQQKNRLWNYPSPSAIWWNSDRPACFAKQFVKCKTASSDGKVCWIHRGVFSRRRSIMVL